MYYFIFISVSSSQRKGVLRCIDALINVIYYIIVVIVIIIMISGSHSSTCSSIHIKKTNYYVFFYANHIIVGRLYIHSTVIRPMPYDYYHVIPAAYSCLQVD